MEFALDRLDDLKDHEQRRSILVDLRPLVPVLGVLHRQFVQIELVLEDLQLVEIRVLERHPDETVRLALVLTDLGKGDVPELPAFLIGRAVDEHAARILIAVRPGGGSIWLESKVRK